MTKRGRGIPESENEVRVAFPVSDKQVTEPRRGVNGNPKTSKAHRRRKVQFFSWAWV